jgi:CDP-diacylglycerol--serine O-phosphatidyltransferase
MQHGEILCAGTNMQRQQDIEMAGTRFTALIPSILTFMNAFCGFISIVLAVVGYAGQNPGLVNLSFYYIFLCVALDILDGLAARLLNAKSSMGAQLDSLSDGLSFGFVPAIHLALSAVYSKSYQGYVIASVAVGLLYLGSVLYRLARFNLVHDDPGLPKHSFQGFPSPGGGLLAVTGCYLFVQGLLPISLVYAFFLLAALLMSSRINYPDLPKQYFARTRSRLELVPVLILLITLGPFTGFAISMLLYMAWPLFNLFPRRVRT